MAFDPYLPASKHPDYYQPLSSGLIRVFELDAGNFSEPIVGRLVRQRIDGERYEAVSYVWGDATKRHDITIDGATLSITANLHGALSAFRHVPGPGDGGVAADAAGKSTRDIGATATADAGTTTLSTQRSRQPIRRLWADAVCINQEDLPERTSQVELMGRIFAGASKVLAWLGWDPNPDPTRRHTVEAVRFIHIFMDDPESVLQEGRVLLLHHDASETLDEHVAHLTTDERRRYGLQKREWEAVKAFFEVEYFHRTWIVQELGLAREAVLYTAVKPVGDQIVSLESVEWPLVGRFVDFLDSFGASLVTHLGLLSWVAHHIMMIWETKEDGTPVWDFLTGMHWARILKVTDARDRVYSLLGHPDATVDGQLVAKPDYTHTRGVIYTRLAAGFVQRTKNLHAVMLVDHEEDPCLEARAWDPVEDGRMPSWVPDWHTINRTTPLDYTFPGAQLHGAEIAIEGDLSGDTGLPMPQLLVSGWVIDKVVKVSRRMETTDFPVTHLTREVAKKNAFWLDRIWNEVVFPASEQAGEELDGADALASLEAISLALSLGTEETEQPPGRRFGGHQTEKEHHRSFAAYVMQYHKLRAEANNSAGKQLVESSAAPTDEISADTYIPRQSLFDTLSAEAQAVIRQRAEGASAGEWLECMTWPSMCRTIFRTASGLVGMGSRVTKPGDLICRIRGSAVLMTLRSSTPGSSMDVGQAEEMMCTHVGPSVVPARMVEGKTDGAMFGERPMRFRIV
jgi:hypothetical protein